MRCPTVLRPRLNVDTTHPTALVPAFLEPIHHPEQQNRQSPEREHRADSPHAQIRCAHDAPAPARNATIPTTTTTHPTISTHFTGVPAGQ